MMEEERKRSEEAGREFYAPYIEIAAHDYKLYEYLFELYAEIVELKRKVEVLENANKDY